MLLGFAELKKVFGRGNLEKFINCILTRKPLIIVGLFEAPKEILQSLSEFSFVENIQYFSGPVMKYFKENIENEERSENANLNLYLGTDLDQQDIMEILPVERGWVLILSPEVFSMVKDKLNKETCVFLLDEKKWVNSEPVSSLFEKEFLDEIWDEPPELTSVIIKNKVKELLVKINIFYGSAMIASLSASESLKKASLKPEYLPLVINIIENIKFIALSSFIPRIFKLEDVVPKLLPNFVFEKRESYSLNNKETLIYGTLALVTGERNLKEIYEATSGYFKNKVSEEELLKGYVELYKKGKLTFAFFKK